MTTRRIISSLVALSLLLSLLLPAQGAARSCDRSETAATPAPAKSHGCAGCSAKSAAVRTGLLSSAIDVLDANITPTDARLCCSDGRHGGRERVDVPTIAQSSTTAPGPLVLFADWFQSGLLTNPQLEPSQKIGESPPYLAALLQHTYRRTSALLI